MTRRRMGLPSFGASIAGTISLAMSLALCLCGQVAKAQAIPTAEGPGSRIEVGAGVSGFQQSYGQRQITGSTFYADLHPHWRYGIEAEARLLNHNTSQDVTLSTYMVGLKVAVRPHPATFEPYAKLMGGVGHIVLPFRYAQGNFSTYAPGGGLDIRVGDFVRVRAIDFEYQRWPDFPYGVLSPYGITTGISFRLNRLRRYPDVGRDRVHGWR